MRHNQRPQNTTTLSEGVDQELSFIYEVANQSELTGRERHQKRYETIPHDRCCLQARGVLVFNAVWRSAQSDEMRHRTRRGERRAARAALRKRPLHVHSQVGWMDTTGVELQVQNGRQYILLSPEFDNTCGYCRRTRSPQVSAVRVGSVLLGK